MPSLTSVRCHYFYKSNSYFLKFIISTIVNELFSLLFENRFSYFWIYQNFYKNIATVLNIPRNSQLFSFRSYSLNKYNFTILSITFLMFTIQILDKTSFSFFRKKPLSSSINNPFKFLFYRNLFFSKINRCPLKRASQTAARRCIVPEYCLSQSLKGSQGKERGCHGNHNIQLRLITT